MKKNWYRSGWLKAIAILLSYVMIVGAAFGAVVLFQMGRAGVSLECDEHFTDSWTFANLVYDNGYRIETELKSKIVKEALAEEKDADTIDVGAFYNGDTPSITEAVSPSKGKETGLVYASEDMFKWAREKHDIGLHGYDYPILKCKTAEGKYHYFYYEEFVQGVVDGTINCEVDPHAKEWFFGETADGGMLNNHSRDEIKSYINYVLYGDVDSLGKITVDTMQSSKKQEYVSCIPEGDYNANLLNPETKKGELYAPEGYENLLDFLNQDTGWWNDKLEMAYNALDSALNELQFYAGGQNNELSAYENGKTNVTYLYADLDNRKIYTNEKVYEDISLLEKNLESMKKQICIQIQSGKASFSNINNIVQDNYLGSLEYHADAISDAENYVFALEINSAFKADDKLAAANEAFNKYAGQLKKVLVFEFVCGVLWLLLMVYLTMVAGRSATDDEIHINGFDRIYTEIGAALVIGIWFTCFFFGMNLYFPRDDRLIMAVWATGMGGLTQTFILIGWLSLVRRIKARNFWKNSICKIACSWIYKIFKKIMGVFGLILNRIKEFIYGKDILLDGLRRINNGEIHYKIPSEKLFGKRKVMADYINNMGSGLDAAVDKAMRSERMKTDLITNVSHDIKTPLTSIINYVDLLKRENFTDPKIQGYLQVLDEKSQRLKILTEDVVEASKASSGNINLEMTDLDFVELIHQVLGEFEEKFEQKNLTMMVHFEDEASVIKADGQRMWRVLSNIFGNVVKYAMEGTRVYAEVSNRDKKVVFSLKNISAQPLNISADELTERFIRGDISRNTEGSGLGLSIAKSLTELQGGEFKLVVDGDLFKVMITFAAEEKK